MNINILNSMKNLNVKLEFFHRQLTAIFQHQDNISCDIYTKLSILSSPLDTLLQHHPDNVSQNSEISSPVFVIDFVHLPSSLMQIDERDIEYEYSTSPRPDIDFGPAIIQFVRTYIASNTSDSFMNYWYGYRGVETPLPFHRWNKKKKKKPRKINDCRPA